MTDLATVSDRLASIEDLKTFVDGLFAHAPVGLAVIQPSGHFMLVNETYLALFGSAPPPEYNILEDEIAQRLGLQAMVAQAFRGETIRTPIFWYDPRELSNLQITDANRIAISLTTFPLYDRSGAIQFVIATYRDHTQEALARERVEAERDRFRALFSSLSDGIILLDEQGRFLEANPAAATILGQPADALAGRSYADFLSDPERWRACWQGFAATGSPVCGQDQLRDAQGQWREVEYECMRPFDQALAPGLSLSLLRDVTASRHLQRERRRLEDQLRQSQKIEAIGRLAGSVAHDFNNLLTVINGYSELVLTDLTAEGPVLEAMQQIYLAGQQAAALTTQLLAFGRKSILKPVVLDPGAVVRKLQTMLQRLLPEDVAMDVRLTPDSGRIRIDPGQLEQVVMNLFLNARDAMPQGGLLLFEVSPLSLSEPLYQPESDQTDAAQIVLPAGEYVMLAVSDNGIGMDDATRQQIFEPFFTTKGGDRGTGLGLSTVYGIVRQSGGQIFVYSEPGHGTTFKLYFPRTALGQPGPASEAEAPLPRGSETILLVEDEKGVRQFVKLVLESCGYTVLAAASATEAETSLGEALMQASLLISDVIMPGPSGPQLASSLQARNPDLKVLYISGYTDDAVLRYGILTSGIPFLAKPFTPSLLARQVRKVLDAEASA